MYSAPRVDHSCFRYESRAELLEAVVPFVRTGLAGGEKCIYLASDHSQWQGPNPLSELTERGLSVLSADGPFLPDRGVFVPERKLAWIEAQAEQALRDGFVGLRLAGETGFVRDLPGGDRLAEYESRLGPTLAGKPISVLCGYRQSLGGFREAISTHPSIVIRGKGCPNPHYLPASEYLSDDRAAAEVDGILDRLWRDHLNEVQRTSLARRFYAAREDERRRVVRVLHDDVGQILAAIQLGLSTGDSETAALVGQAMESLRCLGVELRPSALDDLGLGAALRSYVRRRAGRDPFTVALEVDSVEPTSPEVSTVCFRMIEEALTNIASHAAASWAQVTVTAVGDRAVVLVRDDGRGFDPTAPPPTGAVGLRQMAEQVALVDGELSVESVIGFGTTLRASLPLAGPELR